MEGKRLIKNKKIELAHVSNGYAQTEFYDYEPVSKFVFISKEKSIYSQKIKVELIISQDEILSAKCSCDDCDGYYYWMSNNKACKYKSAAKYGDKEYSCFDILKKRTSELEKCRVKIKEQEIMYRLENLFPVKDIEYETKIVKYEDKDMTQRLQKMVKPFILRRLKTDVLKDLPDKLEETRVVKFDGEQQKLYDAQVVHMKEEIAKNSEEDFNKNKLKILAELTRIRQNIRYFFFHNLQVC